MAEEKEAWEEIRDALQQLVKQGEKQILLLERIEEQGRRAAAGGEKAIGLSILACLAAIYAFGFSVSSNLSVASRWFWLLLSTLMTLLFIFYVVRYFLSIPKDILERFEGWRRRR